MKSQVEMISIPIPAYLHKSFILCSLQLHADQAHLFIHSFVLTDFHILVYTWELCQAVSENADFLLGGVLKELKLLEYLGPEDVDDERDVGAVTEQRGCSRGHT